jgi:hypothetical protein
VHVWTLALHEADVQPTRPQRASKPQTKSVLRPARKWRPRGELGLNRLTKQVYNRIFTQPLTWKQPNRHRNESTAPQPAFKTPLFFLRIKSVYDWCGLGKRACCVPMGVHWNVLAAPGTQCARGGITGVDGREQFQRDLHGT